MLGGNKSYLHVCLNCGWQPHHWMMPETVGGIDYKPVCGQAREKDAPECTRLLERSKAYTLKCNACREAFKCQASNKRKGIK